MKPCQHLSMLLMLHAANAAKSVVQNAVQSQRTSFCRRILYYGQSQRTPQGKKNVCSLALGLHCSCISDGKLDRIGLKTFEKINEDYCMYLYYTAHLGKCFCRSYISRRICFPDLINIWKMLLSCTSLPGFILLQVPLPLLSSVVLKSEPVSNSFPQMTKGHL